MHQALFWALEYDGDQDRYGPHFPEADIHQQRSAKYLFFLSLDFLIYPKRLCNPFLTG